MSHRFENLITLFFYTMKRNFLKKLTDAGNQIFMITADDLKDFAFSIAAEMRVAKCNQDVNNDYMTAKEVCAKLGISRPTLWRWAKTKYLVPIYIGKTRRYKSEDVNRVLGKKK